MVPRWLWWERAQVAAHWRRDTNFDAVTLTGRHAITLVQMVGAWQTPTRQPY